MYIDYVALMLINLVAGLVILAYFLYRDLDSINRKRRYTMRRSRLKFGNLFLALIAAAVLGSLTACATSQGGTPTPPSSTQAPAIKITAPADGSTIPAGDVKVTVQVSNFKLANKLGQANAPGEGHIHYFIDVDAPTTQGKPAVTAAGTYAATADITYMWPNVAAGSHTFSAELVNNDHTPLSTPVTTKVKVTVSGSAGQVPTPTSPGRAGQAVTIDLVAQNISFDKSTITVQAGVNVTIAFDNKDSGMPHNFAVYESRAATNVIFRGETITGPKTINYQFTTPTTPGTYFFRCDVHPTAMTGSFVVTSSS